jgi:urea transport system ATP-binding protein
MVERALELDKVFAGYGETVVLEDIRLALEVGETLSVIGRNGVGKSTLLKLLFGLLPCRQGSVRWGGRSLDGMESARRRALGISYCPQERPVFDDLSVRDNLTLMRADRGLAAFAPLFARFPILERRLDQHAGTLSGGEKKILSFARGHAEGQPLRLLDEPSEGVQWENIVHMAGLIDAARAEGVAFIIVEQNLAFAERIADRYLVIEQGRVVLAGRREDIDRAQLLAHLHV